MRIWKYQIAIAYQQQVLMPTGAKILDLQIQRGQPCLWVLCDENAPTELRNLAVYGTGHPVPDNPGEYIGTFQVDDMLVFHVFERE